MIKPPKLTSGANIGIICPSYRVKEEILKKTVKVFEKRGYKLHLGATTRLRDNPFAGTPSERAKDIMDMFNNPDIDAIICARGGYGANRVIPLLDYDIIRNNPKICMGYSDITTYLISITQKTGLVTFHGPMLVTFKDEVLDYNFQYLESCLGGDEPVIISPPDDLPVRVLKPGKAEGPLWGGNLCLLLNRLGTPDALNSNETILFIEDIGEKFYRFDRMMVHMRMAGMFNNIKALIIGEMIDMEESDTPFGKSTDEIVMDVCGDLDIPIISNFPCGHGRYQATLPISVPVQLQAYNERTMLTIFESSVNLKNS